VEVESFFPGHEAIKPAMTLIKSEKVVPFLFISLFLKIAIFLLMK